MHEAGSNFSSILNTSTNDGLHSAQMPQSKYSIKCQQFLYVDEEEAICVLPLAYIDKFPVQFIELLNSDMMVTRKFQGPKTSLEGVEVIGKIKDSVLLLKMHHTLYLFDANRSEIIKNFGGTNKEFLIHNSQKLVVFEKTNQTVKLYSLDDMENPVILKNFPFQADSILSLSRSYFICRKKYSFSLTLWDSESGEFVKKIDNFLQSFQQAYPENWQEKIGYKDGTQVYIEKISEGELFISFNKGFMSYHVFTDKWTFTDTPNVQPLKATAFRNPLVICVYEEENNPLKLHIKHFDLATGLVVQESMRNTEDYIYSVAISKLGKITLRAENFIQSLEFIPDQLQNNISSQLDSKKTLHYIKLTLHENIVQQHLVTKLFSLKSINDLHKIVCKQFFPWSADRVILTTPPYHPANESKQVQDIEVRNKHMQLLQKYRVVPHGKVLSFSLLGYLDENHLLLRNNSRVESFNVDSGRIDKDYGEYYDQQLIEDAHLLIGTHKEHGFGVTFLNDAKAPILLNNFPNLASTSVITLSNNILIARYNQFTLERWDLNSKKSTKIENFLEKFQAYYPKSWQEKLGYNLGENFSPIRMAAVSNNQIFFAFNRGFMLYNVENNSYKFYDTLNNTAFKNAYYLKNRAIILIYPDEDNFNKAIIDLYDVNHPDELIQKGFREFPSDDWETIINPQGTIGFKGENFIYVLNLTPDNQLKQIMHNNLQAKVFRN